MTWSDVFYSGLEPKEKFLSKTYHASINRCYMVQNVHLQSNQSNSLHPWNSTSIYQKIRDYTFKVKLPYSNSIHCGEVSAMQSWNYECHGCLWATPFREQYDQLRYELYKIKEILKQDLKEDCKNVEVKALKRWRITKWNVGHFHQTTFLKYPSPPSKFMEISSKVDGYTLYVSFK